ncbi:hypothetical protein [Brevibacillus centrosporus]|uniref:hypothetical protein n=1 Tax=Brevibacillus centrosporus TaxID=54910 RepID=UPI003988770A
MKKMSLMLTGILVSIFFLGGTPGFADSVLGKSNSTKMETKQLEPEYAINKPMGFGNVNLVVNIRLPFGKGFCLEDNGSI